MRSRQHSKNEEQQARKFNMSSKQDKNFERHFSDIEESDCDVPMFGEDTDEEEDVKDSDELDYPLEDSDLQVLAERDAGILANVVGPRDRQMVQYNAEYNRLLRDAEIIARNRIATNTRNQYNRANVNFIKWIYFYARENLKEEFIEKFQSAYIQGQEVYLIQVIEQVVIHDEVCPLNLKVMTAKTFFTYILSYKTQGGLFFSFSCYDGKRSAFMHLLSFSSEIWSFKEKQNLASLMQSLKKTIVKEKQELGLRTTEGKDAMSFETYRLTCDLCMKEGTKESMFLLCWLTLQWNLISRSEATEQIAFDQLKWCGDHMKIFFAKHKSDQKGENNDEPRHVYTNPLDPVICPMRALASYLFLFPQIITESQKLFPGVKQRGRFNRLFHDLLARHKDTYLLHGEDPSLLGTHSIRKGAATYCCTAVTPGPPIVSVCLRAGWALGRVKERYLKYDACGDQVVGRTLTGIHLSKGEFGISPVYLNDKTDDKFITQLISYMFPLQGKNLPLITQMIICFMFHEAYTVNTLHTASPLHYCDYFQYAKTDINRLKYVQVSLPWENKEGCPALTGIPLYCSLLHKIYEIADKQDKLPATLFSKFIQELDLRNIGDPDRVIGSKIMTKLDSITETLEQKLNQLKPKEDVPIYDEARVFELTTNAPDATITDSSMKTTGPTIQFPTIGVWSHYWSDRVRQVPQNFTFQSGKTVSSLWRSWHIPDFVMKVCPWRYLKTEDYEHIPRGRTKYNEMKIVIGELLHEISKSKDLSEQYEKGNKNLLVLETIFDKIKYIFQNTNLRVQSLNRMSWESLVKEARNMKHDRERPDSPKRYFTTYVPEPPKKKRGRPRKGTSTTTKTNSTKKTTTPKRKRMTTTPRVVTPACPRRASPRAAASRRTSPRAAAVRTTTTTTQKRYPFRKNNISSEAGDQIFSSVDNSGKSGPGIDPNTFKLPQQRIVLQRVRCGQFETVSCSYCAKPTNHRCLIEFPNSKLIDSSTKKEICGKPYCNICKFEWGVEGGLNRCREHLGQEDV